MVHRGFISISLPISDHKWTGTACSKKGIVRGGSDPSVIVDASPEGKSHTSVEVLAKEEGILEWVVKEEVTGDKSYHLWPWTSYIDRVWSPLIFLLEVSSRRVAY